MDQQQTDELVLVAIWKLLGGKESLQGKNLIQRLSRATGLTELAVQESLAGLAQAKVLSGVYANGVPLGKVTPLVERPAPPTAPSLTAWQEALDAFGLSLEEQAALLPAHALVSDFAHEDRCLLVQGLLTLRERQSLHRGEPSFIVSASYLLGSAKLLDTLPAKALRDFGIDTGKFTGAPSVVLIAGPQAPQNVVLVENPHAFWQAVSTDAVETTAFIVTFGYGLSRHGDDFGNQLASIIETAPKLQSAVCKGVPPPISELLSHPKLQFWGDLDVEGLRIFLRLQRKLPQISLSALYKPMLDSLKNPSKSHAYAQIAAKHKQIKQKMSDNDCQEVIRALFLRCSERAVDQESVTCEEIYKYGQHDLSKYLNEETSL